MALPQAQDASYFLDLQTRTGWGQTLAGFAAWCSPRAGWRTLDVGCGPGLLPALFSRAGCWAVGADLDAGMFQPAPLHSCVVQADGLHLPFPGEAFDLVTASNLLFLLDKPELVLLELRRVLRTAGRLCLLNPSENMSVTAATRLADARGLSGLARETLVNYAWRAERHARWDTQQLASLLAAAGLKLERSDLRMGEGLARLACALRV